MSARSLVSTIIDSCSVAVDIPGTFWSVSTKDGFDEKTSLVRNPALCFLSVAE